MYRVGVVSFLNSKPLIAGLDDDPRVELTFAVPARLTGMLQTGSVDVALVPVIDVLTAGGRLGVLGDGCIASDGETMTVRVLSQVPPDRIDTLHVDGDSHTSVALARVLWRALYGRELALRPLDPESPITANHDAVLLIGDKVVDPRRGGFAFETDLGGAWRQLTGLPFVFAVWAYNIRPTETDGGESPTLSKPARDELTTMLSHARDAGVADALQIAREHGPAHGWPVALAERYLTRCLRYTVDARMRAGADRFAELCRDADLIPPNARIPWQSTA